MKLSDFINEEKKQSCSTCEHFRGLGWIVPENCAKSEEVIKVYGRDQFLNWIRYSGKKNRCELYKSAKIQEKKLELQFYWGDDEAEQMESMKKFIKDFRAKPAEKPYYSYERKTEDINQDWAHFEEAIRMIKPKDAERLREKAKIIFGERQ